MDVLVYQEIYNYQHYFAYKIEKRVYGMYFDHYSINRVLRLTNYTQETLRITFYQIMTGVGY